MDLWLPLRTLKYMSMSCARFYKFLFPLPPFHFHFWECIYRAYGWLAGECTAMECTVARVCLHSDVKRTSKLSCGVNLGYLVRGQLAFCRWCCLLLQVLSPALRGGVEVLRQQWFLLLPPLPLLHSLHWGHFFFCICFLPPSPTGGCCRLSLSLTSIRITLDFKHRCHRW